MSPHPPLTGGAPVGLHLRDTAFSLREGIVLAVDPLGISLTTDVDGGSQAEFWPWSSVITVFLILPDEEEQ